MASHRVMNVSTRDTRRDLTSLLNKMAEQYGFEATGFLGGLIAESALDEWAARERAWPDVSYGLAQPTVRWHGAHVSGVSKAADGTVRDTPRNRQLVRDWFWDAGRSIGYVAPLYAALLARWGDPLSAWCRWNKPNVDPAQNPNRANYERGLALAEQYRGKEEPMPSFKFGFDEYAKNHPEVGKALSDERYFAADLSCQLAEGGLLVYAAQTNEIRFLPAGKA